MDFVVPLATIQGTKMNESIDSTESDISVGKLERMHEELARITDEHRLLYKTTFKPMTKNKGRNGKIVMLQLFSDHPEYKNIWPQFRTIPDSSLMDADVLHKHANVYINGMKCLIDALDDDDKLTSALHRIAKAHVKWGIHKVHVIVSCSHIFIHDTKLQDMLPGFITALSQHVQPTQEVVQAWTLLFDVIANMIDIYRD